MQHAGTDAVLARQIRHAFGAAQHLLGHLILERL